MLSIKSGPTRPSINWEDVRNGQTGSAHITFRIILLIHFPSEIAYAMRALHICFINSFFPIAFSHRNGNAL